MAKTKEPSKTSNKVKSEVKPLSKVKNGAVTKPSQTPIAKSKQVAKEVASKAINGKVADKKSKKVTPPSSDEESDEESAESASSESDSESEAEVQAKKPVAVTNGKAMKGEADSSDSSDSSSDSDSEASDSEASDSEASDSAASDSDASDEEKSAAEDSDASGDESEESAPAAAVVKNAAKGTMETDKAAVNGGTKAVSKAIDSSNDQESGDSASSEDEEEDEDEDEDEDSGDPDDSSNSEDSESASEEDEEESSSKKRKAEAEPATPAKKAKNETTTESEDSGPKNLFIGNLSWNVDDEWLFREFEEFGELVGARIVTDRESGRSKGFGYVEFAKAANAAKALKAKKGALIDGREANVDFSTPRNNNTTPKDRANQRAQNYGDSKNPESDTIFIGNLSFEADEDMVGEAFGAHGTVTHVRLPTDIGSGNRKGFGYVTFASVEDAKRAYENMVGAEVCGRSVRLDFATPRPDRSGGDRGGRGGGRGGRGDFGDRGGRGGGRGSGRGGRGGFNDRGGRGGNRGKSTNRGGFGDFAGNKTVF